MQMHTSRLIVVPLLIVAACTAKQQPATTTDTAAAEASAVTATDEGAVKKTIESLNAKFLDAIARGDTAGAVANYAPDAIVMFPNETAWNGHDAVSKGFASFLSQVALKDGRAATEDVIVSGDIALETGSYEWTMTPKGGKAMKDKGKYLTAWKRQADGSWKIIRDINNSDLPAKM